MTKDYKYIRAWGKLLRSFDYYINEEVRAARKQNAPEDAIYRSQTGWVLFSEINPEVQERVKGYLQ